MQSIDHNKEAPQQKPKAAMSPYERWEVKSFDPPENKSEDLVLTPEVKRRLLEFKSEAKAEGRAEGFAEGREAGYQEGLAQAKAEILANTEFLGSIRDAMASTVPQRADEVAEIVLSLAVDLARTMFRQKVEADASVILPVVREAIDSVAIADAPAKIFLNPLDVEVVQEYLASDVHQWFIEADESIERGGCKVQTRTNLADATNPVRWSHLAESIGLESKWNQAAVMPHVNNAKKGASFA